jgi:hypothetical protein
METTQYIPLTDDIEETTDVDFWLLTETKLDAVEAFANVSPNALRAIGAL